MYKQYFGFKSSPFAPTTDPNFLYFSTQHSAALESLTQGLTTEGGFLVLSGEIGCGKTILSQKLIDHIPRNTNFALLLNPKLDNTTELLAAICDAFDIEYPDTYSRRDLFNRLNARLLENQKHKLKTLLIIDEAQNLSTSALEQLRLLTNLEHYQQKFFLHVLLVGQPELLAKLRKPALRSLEQRVVAQAYLYPLGPDEIGPYISKRLAVAGGAGDIISPALDNIIYQHTRGVPRLINKLCNSALLVAYSSQQSTINHTILQSAIAKTKLVYPTSPSKKNYAKVALLCASVMLVAIASGAWFVYSQQPHLWQQLQAQLTAKEVIPQAEEPSPDNSMMIQPLAEASKPLGDESNNVPSANTDSANSNFDFGSSFEQDFDEGLFDEEPINIVTTSDALALPQTSDTANSEAEGLANDSLELGSEESDIFLPDTTSLDTNLSTIPGVTVSINRVPDPQPAQPIANNNLSLSGLNQNPAESIKPTARANFQNDNQATTDLTPKEPTSNESPLVIKPATPEPTAKATGKKQAKKLLQLNELANDEQIYFKSLNFQGHTFSSSTKTNNNFVIYNNKIYKAKQKINSQLELAEITQQGVILAWKDKLIFLDIQSKLQGATY